MVREIILIALKSLMGNKFRSFLTVLSVTIGAFSIVVMMSLAESGSMTLARSIEDIGGARLVWWVPEPSNEIRDRNRYAKGVTPEDAEAIRKIPYVERATGMSSFRQQTVYYTADNTLTVDVVGMLEGLFEGLNWPIAQGRSYLTEEVAQRERVCVLTDGVASKLFDDTAKAIGSYVTVFGKPYRVIGILKKRKMLMRVGLGFDWDNSVFVPLETAEKRDGMTTLGMVVVAFTQDPTYNPTVVQLGNARMLSRHNGVGDFRSINFDEVVGQFNQFFQAVTLIVGVIAAVSLLAGGIGVMNIMLVSVTERLREIGIRKALGASRAVVLLQFLGEAIVLSTLGGIVGVITGLVVTALAHLGLVNWSEFWVSHYSTTGILLALGVTSAIGLIFGVVPAWQAARLDIVECLRR